MRQVPAIILLVICAGLTSCSISKPEQKEGLSEDQFQELVSQRRTYRQGVLAARSYARETGFRICRYDFPIVRTGYWPVYQYYKHFGVIEGGDEFATLAYHKGFNAEMDRLLLKKYGEEYSKYRSQMVPASDAKPDPIIKEFFLNSK